MTRGQLSERERIAVKAAFARLLKQLGGQEAAALSTRVGQQRLSAYAARNSDDFPPADVIADLERELGEPIVTRVLADIQCHDLTSRAPANDAPLMRRLPRISKETSDVVTAFAEALADGRIDAAEREIIRAEAHHAIGELHALLAALSEGEGG